MDGLLQVSHPTLVPEPGHVFDHGVLHGVQIVRHAVLEGLYFALGVVTSALLLFECTHVIAPLECAVAP